MKIINRYVLREHLGPLLFALTALTSLLLLNYIAKRFGQLVGKGLGWDVIGEFFLLSLPFTIAMTIPMAVLVATLYAFSRLAAENEVTAFKASGVSVRRLLRPVLAAAVVLAIGMIWFNDQVLPRANHRLSILQSDIFRKKPTLGLREQVINRVTDRLWIRADRIEQGAGRMRGVVIYDFSAPERPRTVYADSGTLALTRDMRNLEMVLFAGSIFEFSREEPDRLQRTRFLSNRVLVPDVGNQLERSEGAVQAKGDREMTVCEMQAQYDSAARAYEFAYERLDSLAARAREVGQPISVPARRTTYRERGLGALYCRMLDRVGVPNAFAADVPDAPDAVAGPAAAGPPAAAAQRPAAEEIGTPPMLIGQPGAEKQRRADSLAGALPGPSGVPTPTPVPGAVAGPAPDSMPAPALPPERFDIAPSAGGLESVVEALRIQADLNLAQLNTFDVEIHKKFALAVACIVFVLLGAPIALRFPRGGVGLVIGVSLGVFALYYVCLIAGETVANKGYLPPFVAMWAANLIFGAVGLLLLVRMGREGATARGGDMGELLDNLRLQAARLARRVGMPAERRRSAT